uniref:Uncharacterized protein n=1 Tax=Helianthus annuus TaxID=4232 RepID=A0A251VGM8_HELAN
MQNYLGFSIRGLCRITWVSQLGFPYRIINIIGIDFSESCYNSSLECVLRLDKRVLDMNVCYTPKVCFKV